MDNVPASQAGSPFKGVADTTWPVCSNCQGFGTIGPELVGRAGVKGAKGEACPGCNGVGRVPDAKWPACDPCPRDPEVCFAICGGLGTLSPARQEALKNRAVKVPCTRCGGDGMVVYRPDSGIRPN